MASPNKKHINSRMFCILLKLSHGPWFSGRALWQADERQIRGGNRRHGRLSEWHGREPVS